MGLVRIIAAIAILMGVSAVRMGKTAVFDSQEQVDAFNEKFAPAKRKRL